jgi:hypothetical protein
VAYGIRQNGLWKVVVDGSMGAEYSAISNLVFSPDSQRVAYAAATHTNWMVLIDGQVYAENVGRPLKLLKFGNPEVKGHGANSSINSGQHMLSNDLIWAPEVSFSGDSKHVAYTTETGRVVVDGHAGQGFHGVYSPVLSTDGKHIAYMALKSFIKFKSMKPQWSMVVDDEVSPEYDNIFSSPVFNLDGSVEFFAVKGAGMVKAGSLYRVKYIPIT